jgi:hypothetical protein
MVALNANKTRPAVGTASAFTDMFYSGSMMKVAAMYAAHQLWQSVDDLVDGMDPAIVTDEAKVFAAVHTAFDAKILAASTLIKSSSTVGKRVPQYDLVFQPMKDPVSGKWSVIFRSDVDAKLDFQGHLKKMIVDSHNPSAGFVIQALGFSLIGGLLEQAGFFKPGSKKGVWLAGDYLDTAAKILAAHNDPSGDKDLKEEFNLGISGWNEVRVPSVNDGLSKQATTCIDMARLLVLMVDNRLVTDAIKNEAMLGLLHLAVFGGAKSLITRVAPSTFDIIQSKIGFGTLGTTGRCKADAAGHTHGCVWSETIHVKQNIAPFREFAVVYQNLKDPANNHLSDVERIRDVIAKTMENYQP